MATLYRNKGRCVSRFDLLQFIYPGDLPTPNDYRLEKLVQRLRAKVGKRHILSVRGRGYRYV